MLSRMKLFCNIYQCKVMTLGTIPYLRWAQTSSSLHIFHNIQCFMNETTDSSHCVCVFCVLICSFFFKYVTIKFENLRILDGPESARLIHCTLKRMINNKSFPLLDNDVIICTSLFYNFVCNGFCSSAFAPIR